MSIGNYLQGIGNAVMGRRRQKVSATAASAKKLRYHAGENTNSRDNVTPDPRAEDSFWLEGYEVATTRAREQLRNFSPLGWMLDKHLDFVTSYRIQFDTSMEWLDDWLMELFTWWSQADNFDVGRRYSLSQYMRINEAQKILHGDMGTLKMADGRVLAIDSDQLENGNEHPADLWFRGVRIHPVTHQAIAYRIVPRTTRYGELDHRAAFIVPADHFYLHAERKFYPNLIRGISPIAPALNSIQDCYEGINWHLVKMKIAAMFGMVLFEDENALPHMRIDPDTDEVVQEKPKSKYDVKINGVQALSMGRGEDLKVIESKVPSTESQEFYKTVTMAYIKALNLPYSFYDEKHTNFYGSRGALMHYVRSCEAPRSANTAFLGHLLKWSITKWITDGYIKLPRGYDVRKIRWQCVPRGIPIWDPAKEGKGMDNSVRSAYTAPQKVCMEMGTDYYENIELIKEAREYAERHGITPSWAIEEKTEHDAAGENEQEPAKGDNDDQDDQDN
jgi:capsid protein